jgi:nucleoid-associated protein YgaU
VEAIPMAFAEEERPPEPVSSSQETYVVQSGDSLSAIAQQFYGDANAYMRIFEANRDKLNNPDLIQPGQELVIPR